VILEEVIKLYRFLDGFRKVVEKGLRFWIHWWDLSAMV